MRLPLALAVLCLAAPPAQAQAPIVVAAPRGEVIELPPMPDTQPVPLVRPVPAYPDSARELALEGRVMLSLRIGRDGSVVEARVVHSTDSLFNEAALETARRWRFTPAKLRGEPIETTVHLPFVFRLEEDTPRRGRPRRRGR